MKYEELILKFDNGEISPQELEELSSLLDSQIAEDELSNNIESELGNLDYDVNDKQEQYLAAFGFSFIDANFPNTSANASAAGSLSNGAIKSATTATTSLTKIISIASIALVAAFVAYFTLIKSEDDSNNTKSKSVQELVTNPAPSDAIQSQNTHSETKAINNNESTVQHKESPKAEVKSNSIEIDKVNENKETSGGGEAKAKIIANNSNQNEILKQNLQLLKDAETSSNLPNQIIYNRKLGVLYRDMPNQLIESKNYLTKAHSQAKQINNAELSAELLGELALCEYKLGNINAALEMMNSCTEQLKAQNSSRLAYWNKKKQNLLNWK